MKWHIWEGKIGSITKRSEQERWRGTMLYWNRDHRGRAVSFFFDFSSALAIRNLNTFAEMAFVASLLLSDEAYPTRCNLRARMEAASAALSISRRVHVLTADRSARYGSRPPLVLFVSPPRADPGSCCSLSFAPPSFSGPLSRASPPESAGSSAF